MQGGNKVDRELDQLIVRLKQSHAPRPLMNRFEDELLVRIAERSSRSRRARPTLPLQMSAVAVAFAIGLVVGLRTPHPPPPAQTLLAEVLEP